MGTGSRARCAGWVVGLAAAAPAGAGDPDAPLFTRPFDGVPVAADEFFGRIVPPELVNWADDDLRALDPGGGALPADLPPRFTDEATTPSTTGMTAGGAYLGQFIDHDLTLSRLRFDEVLVEPLVFALFEIDGQFINRRTPGFDLDPLYRISPIEFPSEPGNLGPWDLSNLRFRFGLTDGGALDFIRGPTGLALIGDNRNDENGVVAQIHRAFMKLHNVQIDRILAREGIDEASLEFLGPLWWDVFNEARNYTTAYYQGIVANEYAAQLTGRTLFDALDDEQAPPGPLDGPLASVELAGCLFRLHTLIPNEVPLGPARVASPIGQELREGVAWPMLFGPDAHPAGRLDTAVAAPLRDIVALVIPGTVVPITIDLAQVNVLRGREMRLPSGEEYLAYLLDELGLDPSASTVRGKQVLTRRAASGFLDPIDDADLLADLRSGDTDLWAYVQLEAVLNGGVLGPVGQDILERNWLGLLLADDWSLLGANSDQFTAEQMAFFASASFDRLLEEILSPADLDRDGRVGILDFLALLAAWGQLDSPADLDGDGVVGAGDVEILFDEWGV